MRQNSSGDNVVETEYKKEWRNCKVNLYDVIGYITDVTDLKYLEGEWPFQ